MMAKVNPTRSWNLVCICSQQIVCFCKYNSEKPFCPCKYRRFKIGSKNSVLCRQCEYYLGEFHRFFKTKNTYSKKLWRNISPSNVIFDI